MNRVWDEQEYCCHLHLHFLFFLLSFLFLGRMFTFFSPGVEAFTRGIHLIIHSRALSRLFSPFPPLPSLFLFTYPGS